MNTLAALLLLGLSALPANIVLEEEIVVVTADDLERKNTPVFFAVHRLGHAGFSIDFALIQSSRMAADLGPYQLCVFRQPLVLADLPGVLARTDLIARTQLAREERATFELPKEDIARSALMVYQVARSRSGTRNVRGFCLPLAELMKTVRLDSRRPLPENDRSSVA